MTQTQLYNDVLRALSLVLDIDEGQKLYHAWRVGLLSFRLAEYMDITNHKRLFATGLLHDIGGIGLEDHIVHHSLNGFKDHRARAHPQKGAAILSPFSLFNDIVPFIADHHEHYDGTGFPSGKKGAEIPVGAAIVLMADILDVSLRGNDVRDRQKSALEIAIRVSGQSVAPRVAEAAIGLFKHDDTLIPKLFDNDLLKEQVFSVNTAPTEVETLSRQEMLSQLLWLFARVIDVKHVFTMGHSTRVTFYVKQIVDAFGNDEINQWDVLWAGLLHDVGIISVPDPILRKSTALTDSEKRLYQKHAAESIKIISSISDLAYLAYPAAAHHEWYDGSGYPKGKAEENIPLLGRVLAFADTYDALTNRQGFNEKLSHVEAIEMIAGRVGTQFDPHIAPIALAVMRGFNKIDPRSRQRMKNFQLFFKEQNADIGNLLIDPGSHRTPLIMAERGLILGELQPWRVLELSADLLILSGKEDFIQLTVNSPSNEFVDFLDEKEKSDFKKIVSNLEPEGIYTRYFITASSHPIEMIIVARQTRYRILYRSAAQKIDPLKRMSLLHRNFMTSAEGTVFLNPHGDIIDANRSFLALYGYELNEVTGQKMTMLNSTRQPASTYDGMWQCLTDRQIGTWSGEMINRHKTGQTITVILTINALFDSNGAVVGYIGQHHDITERKNHEIALQNKDLELERKNRELEKLNRLKSDLMAITSHDLKSPISAMIGYADLLKAHFENMSKDKVVHYLEGIMKAGHNQLQFISDLLDLYQFESDAFVVEKKPIRIHSILQDSIRTNAMAGKTKRIAINLTTEGPISVVQADSMRIQQVLDNLLSNAVKFSPEGSQVDVRYREIGAQVLITVDDQGPGIAEIDLDRIFDRNYQVKTKSKDSKRFQGIGLGLYISKNIIVYHNGTLHAENLPQRGCRFTIKIPFR